jgi:exodeoxyribonuclease VII small subunit
MAVKKSSPPDFEQSLQELEQIVQQMEQGELSLEDSLKYFERGIELTRSCQATLRLAGQRVEQLLEKNGQFEIVPFDTQS